VEAEEPLIVRRLEDICEFTFIMREGTRGGVYYYEGTTSLKKRSLETGEGAINSHVCKARIRNQWPGANRLAFRWEKRRGGHKKEGD